LGRTARGVRAITLREGDQIVGFDVIEATPDSSMLVVTNDGFGKRVKLEEFRQQGRGGVGIIGTKFKNAQSKLAALRVVNPGEGVIIATANGVVVRQSTDEISMQGRMATGVRLQQLGENDSVMSVTPVVEPNEVEGEKVEGADGDAAPEASTGAGPSDATADGAEDSGIIDGGGDEAE
jgi:DNA gyrase subunit A